MMLHLVLFSIALLDAAAGYRPVIIIHGLFDGPKQFTKLASFISQTHPGTNVTTVDLYDDMASLKPLWEQVKGFKTAMGQMMENATDGVHLICFSQGGLVCRGVLATIPKHNVHSLIFLSSPLAGQYGDTSYFKYFFPKYIKSKIYHLCYTLFGQKISICNFWKDPHQRERYLKTNNYLALLNGEREHPNITQWRKRFVSIKKLVLIGGPDDGVITPWQSSFYGFYDSNETVVEMKAEDWYLKDAFGLKTLDSRGDLVQFPGRDFRTSSSAEPHMASSRMTTRSKSEGCRVCGCDLKGNQRRWLFGGQNRKGGQAQTPTPSFSKESASTLPLSRSAQSSPWGSTLSLGSSYKSHTLPTPNKGMDPLSVLTHILGQSVPRGNRQGEFICSKCVFVLERVFKFDTVIARVKVLSRERLQKLNQERDHLRRWVRSIYRQRNPSDLRSRGSSSEDDAELREGGSGSAYREMLRDNMALSAYECWSEKSDSCPYFRRTGERCGKGKNCECCDSLRVSDSDYESVCGIPRHLPEQALSPCGLSRNKSQSMPLHWSRVLSSSSSPASLAGSCHSLRVRSRTGSAQSLDSLDGADPFDWPEEQPVNMDSILQELKGIEGKPVQSPAGSRIPVLGRAQEQNGVRTAGSPKVELVRVLNFGDQQEDEVDGESEDILTELRDEFVPLHRGVATGRVHLAVRQLREQLDQAQARIRTLEAGLREGTQSNSSNGSQSEPSMPMHQHSSSEDENGLIHHLSHSLQSRERVIQECVTLIRKLCVELGAGLEEADKLIRKVTLTETRSECEGVSEAEFSELKEREHGLQKELEALRQAGKGRDRDLITLNTVLQCNQDVINHLRVELAEKTRSLQDMQKEREIWKERDSALGAALQEKETLVSRLQEALKSSRKDVQALSDSLIGRGLPGGGAETALVSQVQEKETLLAACLKDQEQHTGTMKQEVSNLLTALKDAETVIQDQRLSHQQAIGELTEQLRCTRKELREAIKENKEAEQAWHAEKAKRDIDEGRLKESLQKRDKLIEQVLLDAEKRDGMLIELQQNISSKLEPRDALKHTL
ncbi:hypothetical protein MHYP_G00201520 [Metynnis hypsauchen]